MSKYSPVNASAFDEDQQRSIEELYKIINEQQQTIESQAKRIKELEDA